MDEEELQRRLAKQISRVRQDQGMTQQDLTAASGLTVEAVSLLERAERAPRLGTLGKLAAGVNVSVAGLFAFAAQAKPRAFRSRDLQELNDMLESQPVARVRLVAQIAKLIIDA